MHEKLVGHLRDVLGLSPDEIPAFYATFLKTVSGCVEQLRGAAAGPDYTAIRAATHTLMGFSRNVGAADLGDAALALNGAAHAADPAACAIGIREIEALYRKYAGEGAAAGDDAR